MGRDYIGCDIGGTAVKIVRLRGRRIVDSRVFDTPRGSRVEIVAALVGALNDVARGGRRAAPLAVGVAVPGFLDRERKRVERLSNLPALNGSPLKGELARKLGLPVFLDADTNAGGVAEATSGAGRNFRRVLYLSLGTGLGASLVIDGLPARVSHQTVGHVAHIPLQIEPSRRRETAESQLGARGIVRRASRAGLRGVRTPAELQELARASTPRGTGHGGSRRTLVRSRARTAQRVWGEVGALVGTLTAILGGVFAPEVAVVGGGTAGAASLFVPSMRRALQKHSPRELGAPPVVAVTVHGRWAGAIGSACLARRELEG